MNITVKNTWFVTALLGAAAIYAGCNKGPDLRTFTYPAPEPQAVSPDIDYAGRLVTITGTSFGDYASAVKVYFNGILADTVISCEDTKIVVKVPNAAISGKVSLQVWTNKIDSIGTFTVKVPPTIKTANPLTGLPGDTVRIYGTGFENDITKVVVNFNGTSADVAAVEDTVITTTVPMGASSGPIGIAVNNYPVKGPGYSLLVSVPTPSYQLDFEDNLNDKISGAPATYIPGDQNIQISYAAGISGKAAVLPGVLNSIKEKPNQAISIPTAIAKQREFTVACWVWWDPARNASQDPIFEFGEARGSRITVLTRMSGNWNSTSGKMVGRYLLEKKIKDAAGTLINYEDYFSGPLFPQGTWTHVAFTFSYANLIMKLYVNGTLASSKTLTKPEADPFLMTMNRAYVGAPAYNAVGEPSFGGMLDKFQVWNSVLSPDQIYTLWFRK